MFDNCFVELLFILADKYARDKKKPTRCKNTTKQKATLESGRSVCPSSGHNIN